MKVLNPYRLSLAVLLFACGTTYAQPGSTTDPTISGGGYPGVNKDWVPSKTPDGAYDLYPM